MPLSRIKTFNPFQKYRIAHEINNGILVKTDTTLTKIVFSNQIKTIVFIRYCPSFLSSTWHVHYPDRA